MQFLPDERVKDKIILCSLCGDGAVDSRDFETGNNAEYSISVNLCPFHMDELEKLGYGFEEKYSYEFEKILAEKFY